MAFQQALSGLSVASKQLDAIGNNVANASTVGFKQSRAEFSDIFANSLFGVSSTATGIGAQVQDVAQQFTQGNVTSTSNPTDLAISGNGFFRMQSPTGQSVSYTRNGQFQIDNSGFVVNGINRLTGYSANALGAIVPGPPVPIQVNSTNIGAAPTTSVKMIANFNGSAAQPAVAFPGVVVPTATPDPNSYNWSTQVTAYDSLGAAHAVTLYAVKTATALQWNIYAQFDQTTFAAAPPFLQQLTFSPNGTLPAATPASTLTVTGPLANGANGLTITTDFTKLTSFSGAFGVNQLTVDGFANGSLTGISVAGDGTVSARFSNGQTKAIGQVVLANFANPQGLQNLGGNQWGQTTVSGTPTVNAPGTGNAGSLQSAALEDSNVDLTTELVHMITAQRFYQANAQAIKTQDQVLQTLLNI